jgi:small subunit ribosomal protein S7
MMPAKNPAKRSMKKGQRQQRQRRPRFDEEVKEFKRPPRKERREFDIKLFGRWDSKIEVNDPGLRTYVNLQGRLLPRTEGRLQKHRFHKSDMHIVERLATHFMGSGHQGKKHKITSGRFGGAYMQCLENVENALEIIEKKENKNPVEVLIRAIENAAAKEEIISYQLGSIMAREAVITAPQRRVDKTLRNIAQGAYRKSFNSKKNISEALAEEIILAAKNSSDSHAIKERERIEREAASSR